MLLRYIFGKIFVLLFPPKILMKRIKKVKDMVDIDYLKVYVQNLILLQKDGSCL